MSLINSLSAITFDPYILNVDFLSFHPYPDLSNLSDNTYEEVRREINWISNVMKPIGKPWIIGETSFPGYSLTSNIQNTGTYQQQKDYAKFVLDEAFSAGASGLAWWQYKNVFWPGIIPNCCADTSLTAIYPSIQNWHNSENYYGVKAHDGSLKPIVGGSGLPITNNVFMNYQVNMGCSCLFPSNNYYQSISNPLYTINGIVKDVNQNLVKDALIIGWDGSWNSNKVTYTKSDGSFSLQSNFLISSMKICGLGFINSEQNSPISGLTYTISPVSCGQGNARIANNIDINDEKEMSGEFILYPNPNNGTFSITSEKVKETFNVEVYNNLGRLVFEKENNDPEKSNFSISELPKGIYIVILTTNSFSEKKKIIIF